MIASILEGYLIHSLIFKCRCETENVEERVAYLYEINNMLPVSGKLIIPKLLTDDYIDRALDTIEEKLFSFRENHTSEY